MRLTAAHAILQSRVGRQLLATFFVLVALPVVTVSLLAYQLTEYALQQSAAQLGSELAKTAGIQVIDRLRAGERLLTRVALFEGGGAGPVMLDPGLEGVFSAVERQARTALPESVPHPPTALHITGAAQPEAAPTVEMVVTAGGVVVRGRFTAEHLWENAQSGTHRICFSGPQLATPFCQGVAQQSAQAVQTQREIFFAPYFDSPPWTVVTTVRPDLRRYFPIGVAALVGNVAAIAFLLALIASSVVLRRLTQPLDALTSGTRAVLRGDFTGQVRIHGKRSEFTDLADSFNVMADEVGRDLALFRVLAQMDQAIIEQQPFDEVVRLMLLHLQARRQDGATGVVLWSSEAADPLLLTLAPGGEALQQEGIDVDSAEAAGHPPAGHDLPVAQLGGQRVWLRLPQPPAPSSRAERELGAFRQRLAVALHAEQHERQLRERATHDSLTGLLNRLGLLEAIEQQIRAATDGTAQPPFAVVYMDLDGFKEINDAFGHSVGDRVLREVASRLHRAAGPRALAMARPAGDEFVFVLPADAAGLFRADIDAVMQSLRQPVSVPPHLLDLGASLGVALFPAHGATPDELLGHADLAMYTAKAAGRNLLVEFQPALAAGQAERLALRHDLHHALAAQQMFVVFQPRVGARDRHVASVEALVRWRHPEKGMVPPDTFIAMAEESGLILELGLWVLRQALQQLARWRADPRVPVRHLSVNLSPVQLADPGFPAALHALMDEFVIEPGELELEITEGALIQDVDVAVERLSALRARGVAIALDDFGVGYSAMRYLNRLPFDTLKIDKSFVFAFGVDRPALAIATAIVALAKALDKRVVAEGVETQMQADLLQALEVNELQGYLFGKPQTAAELARLWETVDGVPPSPA